MILEYKNYIAKVELQENGWLYGTVLNLTDKIIFQAERGDQLKKEFEASVEDYLNFCKEDGVDPEKPFSGKISFRTSEECHKRLSKFSKKTDTSINELIDKAVATYLEEEEKVLYG